MKDLSVIIPAFNEEACIGRCLDESLRYLRGCEQVGRFEIIVVAERGTDRTIELLQSRREPELRVVVSPRRRGKGEAVRLGMRLAAYPYALFYDADMSTPVEHIREFLSYRADIVIGSRNLKTSRARRAPHRKLLSAGFRAAKSVILGLPYNDTQCGFKLFNERGKRVFELLTIRSSAFDAELLFIARRKGLCVVEAPVCWNESERTSISPIAASFDAVASMLRVRANGWRGKY